MKKAVFMVGIMFATLLNGCGYNENAEVYLDVEKTKQQIKDDELNIEVKDFVYDDNSANIMSNGFTMDSEFFIIFHIRI